MTSQAGDKKKSCGNFPQDSRMKSASDALVVKDEIQGGYLITTILFNVSSSRVIV